MSRGEPGDGESRSSRRAVPLSARVFRAVCTRPRNLVVPRRSTRFSSSPINTGPSTSPSAIAISHVRYIQNWRKKNCDQPLFPRGVSHRKHCVQVRPAGPGQDGDNCMGAGGGPPDTLFPICGTWSFLPWSNLTNNSMNHETSEMYECGKAHSTTFLAINTYMSTSATRSRPDVLH